MFFLKRIMDNLNTCFSVYSVRFIAKMLCLLVNFRTVMYQLTAPNAICGRVIGRGGSKINSITVCTQICRILFFTHCKSIELQLYFLLFSMKEHHGFLLR